MRPIDVAVNQTVAFVLEHVPAPPLRILDVGCGKGLIASRLNEEGYDIVAIDESAESVQQTRELGVDAKVATWPTFEEAPFDVVLFSSSLHHIHPLAEAVKHAHRLLAPGGLVIVEEFAWTEIDRVTAEWFYGVARLLASAQVLEANGDRFVTRLIEGGGDFPLWRHSHAHDLHPVDAMWSALQAEFQSLDDSSAPYLYHYLCPALPQNEAGYAIVSEVLELEARFARLGTIKAIGRRFVGRRS